MKRTDINSIPYNFDIEICESQSDEVVVIKIPAYFKRVGEKEDISLDYYDDDGAYICLRYSTNIVVDSMESLLADVEQLYGEIEGATDIALGSPFQKIADCEKENEFTIKILLPLFRKLGFVNVKYNHGNKEFGKDVTFARRTEFDEYEYYVFALIVNM